GGRPGRAGHQRGDDDHRAPGRRAGAATNRKGLSMATITGSEVLAKALRTQGIDTMFYVMGGPMLETEAACIQLGIKAIDTRHEQAASLSAHAWTRVMQRPAVAMGCSGPGATNLLTGVANAFTDCAPMVAIGGSSPRVFLGMEAFQEIDQVAVFKAVTKFAARAWRAPSCRWSSLASACGVRTARASCRTSSSPAGSPSIRRRSRAGSSPRITRWRS